MAMQITSDVAVVHADLPKLAVRMGSTCEQHAELLHAFLHAIADGFFDEQDRQKLIVRTSGLIADAQDLLRALEQRA